MLFLGRPKQAPARALVNAGVAVALASDFNPGTSPTVNFPLVLTLGVSQLRLSVAEAFVAATVNGAAALGLAGEVGQLAPGFQADLALFDVRDHREIPYWYGDQRCRRTWVGGGRRTAAPESAPPRYPNACHATGSAGNFPGWPTSSSSRRKRPTSRPRSRWRRPSRRIAR
jgi:cytosine/adenosine deaminase-related metal-dependent hydrolase